MTQLTTMESPTHHASSDHDIDMEKSPATKTVTKEEVLESLEGDTSNLVGPQTIWTRLKYWGVELRGIVPVPIEERTDAHFVNIFSLLFTMSLNVLAYAAATLEALVAMRMLTTRQTHHRHDRNTQLRSQSPRGQSGNSLLQLSQLHTASILLHSRSKDRHASDDSGAIQFWVSSGSSDYLSFAIGKHEADRVKKDCTASPSLFSSISRQSLVSA